VVEKSIEERAGERADFLLEIALDLMNSGIIPDNAVILRKPRLKLASEAYYILSDAYKLERIKKGHYTEEPKMAALSMISIMQFQPFLPLDFNNVETRAVGFANETFSITVALAMIGKVLDQSKPSGRDFWLRLIDIASEVGCETLQPFIVDINLQISDRARADYVTTIHPKDWLSINSLISIMELLSGKIKAV
jgi:hypothetical protein